ncbi:MAG: SDR family oxidoreductase [Salinarimonas sp.]|nr:SDR family oxidoreductase [Salinarimonas sp.]
MQADAAAGRAVKRHVLVTGGARGIGRAIAGAFRERGMRVSILGRDRAALDEALAARVADFAVSADVTDAQAMADEIAAASEAGGAIDCLIANAGAAATAPFARSDADRFRAMTEVNLIGVVNAIHPVLPGMTERGFGRIIVVASTAALKGYAYVSAYCAAKHAALGLVRALALETARKGVTVNALCPGFTDTDMVATSLDAVVAKTGRSREEALAEFAKHNPQGRLVDPREVADAALWLAGDAAGAVTGQAIAIAGGEV